MPETDNPVDVEESQETNLGDVSDITLGETTGETLNTRNGFTYKRPRPVVRSFTNTIQAVDRNG